MKNIFEIFLLKINVKSVSLMISLVLIFSGIMMCLNGLEHQGYIDIKNAFLSGKIQTGSLGLMVIFLGVLIIIYVIQKSGIRLAKKGERIELEIEGKRIVCENLPYRKVQEIHQILKSNEKD